LEQAPTTGLPQIVASVMPAHEIGGTNVAVDVPVDVEVPVWVGALETDGTAAVAVAVAVFVAVVVEDAVAAEDAATPGVNLQIGLVAEMIALL
jgi:hypothetical protein